MVPAGGTKLVLKTKGLPAKSSSGGAPNARAKEKTPFFKTPVGKGLLAFTGLVVAGGAIYFYGEYKEAEGRQDGVQQVTSVAYVPPTIIIGNENLPPRQPWTPAEVAGLPLMPFVDELNLMISRTGNLNQGLQNTGIYGVPGLVQLCQEQFPADPIAAGACIGEATAPSDASLRALVVETHNADGPYYAGYAGGPELANGIVVCSDDYSQQRARTVGAFTNLSTLDVALYGSGDLTVQRNTQTARQLAGGLIPEVAEEIILTASDRADQVLLALTGSGGIGIPADGLYNEKARLEGEIAHITDLLTCDSYDPVFHVVCTDMPHNYEVVMGNIPRLEQQRTEYENRLIRVDNAIAAVEGAKQAEYQIIAEAATQLQDTSCFTTVSGRIGAVQDAAINLSDALREPVFAPGYSP